MAQLALRDHPGTSLASPDLAGHRAPGRLAAAIDRNTFPIVIVSVYAATVSWLALGSIGSDTWLSLLAGREIAEGGLPRTDGLTVWAHGREWVDQQWLAQLLFHEVSQAGGIVAVAIVNAAVLVAALALAVVAARRLGGSATATAVVAVPCVILLLPYGGARAQPLAYMLFVALFWLLVRQARRPSSAVVLAAPLLALWANVHGSVVLGAALVSLLGLTEAVALARRRSLRPRPTVRAALLIAAPWAFVLASPYAAGLPGYYASVLGSAAFKDVVSEWTAPTLSHNWPFFVVAVAAASLVAVRRRSFTSFEKLALLVLVAAGLDATRNIVWVAFAVLLLAPRALDGVWSPQSAPRRPTLNVAISAVAVAFALLFAVSAAARLDSAVETGFPPAAARAVSAAAEQRPTARVFANEKYADWLIWRDRRLAGRVAFDARFELLSDAEIRSIARFRARSGAAWRRPADGSEILVLDAAAERGVVRSLLAGGDARTLYRDREVAVLIRR